MAAKETTRQTRSPFAPTRQVFPSPDPVLGFIDARQQVSLNGKWRMIIDPMGVGQPGGMFGGFPRNKKVTTGMELVEYDFDTAQLVSVPGDWNTQDDRLFFYQGRCWYFRHINYAPKNQVDQPVQRQHLCFDGANFTADIYLNSKPIGQHVGGYVPFSFDVTDDLQPGSNELMICVDNRLSETTVPTERTDWWPYGGLTRDVMLVETPAKFIRNAKIQLRDATAQQIRLMIDTVGTSVKDEVRISIAELNIELELDLDANGQIDVCVDAAPQLWHPQEPKRYRVELSLGDDHVYDDIGFRWIETRGREIYLNGQGIKLRGISTHEEPIGEPGVAYSYAHARRLLQEAKALNANFVRAAHYPYSRHMARAADELGIMLWAEVPVYWNIAWDDPTTLEIARNQLQRLILRDWNRASVIIWSVANETTLSEPRMAFLSKLIDDARMLDETRLVSAALLGGGGKLFKQVMAHIAVVGLQQPQLTAEVRDAFTTYLASYDQPPPQVGATLELVIDDPLGELVDIVGYNQYFGWYYSVYFAQRMGVGEDVVRPLVLALMPSIRISATVDKPVHISECGAEAVAGRHGEQALLWTEEYQLKVYQAQIEMVRRSEQVQGLTPWILKDFRAMLRPLAGVQDYYNRKGLVDEHGTRKLAFTALEEFYATNWQ